MPEVWHAQGLVSSQAEAQYMVQGSPPFAVVIVSLLLLGFYIYCLVDFSRTDEFDIRTFDRTVWIFILVFTNIVGGLLWLTVGRAPRR